MAGPLPVDSAGADARGSVHREQRRTDRLPGARRGPLRRRLRPFSRHPRRADLDYSPVGGLPCSSRPAQPRDRVRQAGNRPVRPLGRASGNGRADGRHTRRDGCRRIAAGCGHRYLRGRNDVRSLRGDLPGAVLGANFCGARCLGCALPVTTGAARPRRSWRSPTRGLRSIHGAITSACRARPSGSCPSHLRATARR